MPHIVYRNVARDMPVIGRYVTNPMKRTNLLRRLSLLLVALPLSVAAMTNRDIIKLHEAGLKEETILSAMQKEPADYDTSPAALVDLKRAGVSERVIQRMIGSSSPASMPTGRVTTPALASPVGSVRGSGPFWQEYPVVSPAATSPIVGQTYFTRYTFHEERNSHSTTNYARGAIVPINTQVQLLSMAGSKLTLRRLDTGEEIKVDNEEKYTKKPISQIAALMLSNEPTPLDVFPPEVAAAIRNGEMRLGMTKDVLIMARGYPPAHETPSVESDRWVYWSSRFVKQTVVFANGRLNEGRGLY